MQTALTLHRHKLLTIAALLLASVLANWYFGHAKPWASIDWLDVVGEGGSALALGVWLILILASRPAGRVTDLLSLGLGFMFLAFCQDVVDEFIRLPNSQWWEQGLENIAMPLGISLLTYGLFHWHSEQLAINEQLKKRERVFREHRMLDRLTQIGKVDYLKKQIQQLLHQQQELPLTLLMIDVDNFHQQSRLYGHRESDRLLHEISELLLLNLRDGDLICRYGGDRFAVLLPETPEEKARQIAFELQQAVRFFAFKLQANGETCYQRIHIGLSCLYQVAHSPGIEQQMDDFLHSANQQLAAMRLSGQVA